MVIKIRVLRLRSTDWKSSLSTNCPDPVNHVSLYTELRNQVYTITIKLITFDAHFSGLIIALKIYTILQITPHIKYDTGIQTNNSTNEHTCTLPTKKFTGLRNTKKQDYKITLIARRFSLFVTVPPLKHSDLTKNVISLAC